MRDKGRSSPSAKFNLETSSFPPLQPSAVSQFRFVLLWQLLEHPNCMLNIVLFALCNIQ